MLNKNFFLFIQTLQQAMLVASIGLLIILPILLAYADAYLPENLLPFIFTLSLASVALVMSIRPLADLVPTVPWIRPLVILRKGFGVFSASLIVAIMLSKVMTDGGVYMSEFFSPAHWVLTKGAILAPLGDLSALILLLTSNQFSKRVLGKNWKRIQRLSYVYFYAGALYEMIVYQSVFATVVFLLVSVLVVLAWIRNRARRMSNAILV